jgi:hypothetical protein
MVDYLCEVITLDGNTAVILSACITAMVTIIGFVVTYFLNKRNFKEEINKQQVNIHLDKIAELPYKIQELMDIILDKKNDKAILSKFKELMFSIFAYGSKDAIILVTNMQELNYILAASPDKADKNMLIAYYILLLCQVKYDLTGIEINPEFWYRMRLTDYSKMKSSLDKSSNEIVKRLELNSFLKIGSIEV